MAIEVARMPLDHRNLSRRYYETPPGLPLAPRIKGKFCWIGASLVDKIQRNPRAKHIVSGTLSKIGVDGSKIGRKLAKTLDDIEMVEDYLDPVSPREQIETLLDVGGPLLRLERQRIFSEAKGKKEQTPLKPGRTTIKTLFNGETRGKRVAIRVATAATALIK